MADSDRTQRLVDRALQCVDRARRVINHPEEAFDLAHDLRDFAGEFMRWGLEKVPIARDFLPPEPPPEPEPGAWERDPEAAPPFAAEETTPLPPVAEPPADEEEEGKGVDESIGKDQLYKVLRVLFDETVGEGRFLTAREIADAAKKAGFAILPGNVRKILRTRAARHVDTRLRDAETGKVTEFKLAAKGRSWFQRNYPVQ
ncbi:MAG: hypothetical protein HY906_19600 [Deltaproteobacteria bacterium]|nr:hypothetical protein [Deltaproteobacteria bacterium]